MDTARLDVWSGCLFARVPTSVVLEDMVDTSLVFSHDEDFYCVLDIGELGVDFDTVEIGDLCRIPNKIKKCADEQAKVHHPETKGITELHEIMVTDLHRHPEANCRNFHISGTHIDRAPCATGTRARWPPYAVGAKLG